MFDVDKEWLSSLRFESTHGFTVDGFVGMGAEMITLGISESKYDKPSVLQVRRNHLAFAIREIPLFLSGEPRYDVNRVNAKLAQLVGDPLADLYFHDIDRLFQSVMSYCYRVFKDRRDAPLSLLGMLPFPLVEMVEIMQTFGFRRRIEEIATLKRTESFQDMFLTASGPDFKIEGERDDLIDWAQSVLKQLETLPRIGDLSPETLFSNHILVWSSAAADGFFTDDEIPLAAKFIEQNFGRLTDLPNAHELVSQLSIVASLQKSLIREPKLDRFKKLGFACGAMFPIVDKDGNAEY